MSDPRPGNFAHLPFLPAGIPPPYTDRPPGVLLAGSFVQGITEESFMKYIWRVRKWKISTVAPVVFHTGNGPPAADNYVYFDSTVVGGQIISLGASTAYSTAAYTNLDDILCAFRQTDGTSSVNPVGPFSVPAQLAVKLEATGDYTGSNAFNIQSSQLTLQDFSVIDAENGLSTNPDLYTFGTALKLHFDPDGDNIIRTLFAKDITSVSYPSWSWSGGPIHVKPHEYWSEATGVRMCSQI